MNDDKRDPTLDLHGARYLEALEHDDFITMDSLWEAARTLPGLASVLVQLHLVILDLSLDDIDEDSSTLLHDFQPVLKRLARGIAAYKSATSPHLKKETSHAITVSDIAKEVIPCIHNQHSKQFKLIARKLRNTKVPPPEKLDLASLIEWGNSMSIEAPLCYWKEFQRATRHVKRRLEADRRRAARRASRPDVKP